MQTYAATTAAKKFGELVDHVQSEPVIITKKDRPVMVAMSMKRAQYLENAALEAGIQRGLDDMKAGRGRILTQEYADEMLEKFIAKHISKGK